MISQTGCTAAMTANRALSPNAVLYGAIFLVTQVTGLLLSLAICYVLQDYIWGFVRMALINSFITGLGLIGGCYLSQRLIFTMRVVSAVGITFSLVLGVAVISFVVVLAGDPALFIYYGRGATAFLIVNFLFIVAVYSIGSGLIFYREIMVRKEKAIGAQRALKKQMELRLLASKVSPHFLFNTLNMIVTLLKQPAKAEEALLNLSDLLRHNLDQSEHASVPVSRELHLVEKYLHLQSLRFGDKLRYEIHAGADFEIPPMIIQPLVENSIKHNIGHAPRLSITLRTERDANGSRIIVEDSERRLDTSMLDSGRGLSITRQRVEHSNGRFAIRDGGIAISFPR